MHPLIARHRSGISDICRRYHITRLDVFGSAAGGNDFDSEHSDADFVVEFAPDARAGLGEFFGARMQLSQLLGREVALIEQAAVRNPYVLAGIQESRELVYAARPASLTLGRSGRRPGDSGFRIAPRRGR